MDRQNHTNTKSSISPQKKLHQTRLSKIIDAIFQGKLKLTKSEDVSRREQFYVLVMPNGGYRIIPDNTKMVLPIFRQNKNKGIKQRIIWILIKYFHKAFFSPIGQKLGSRQFKIGIKGIQNFDWAQYGIDERPDLTPIIFIGPADLKQKAFIYLSTSSGSKIIRLIKFPIVEQAREKVLKESEILSYLKKNTDVKTSIIYHTDPEHGSSTQSMVNGTFGVNQMTETHLNYLLNLVHSNRQTSLHEQRKRLAKKFSSLDFKSEEKFQLFNTIFEILDDSTPIKCVIEHGDFKRDNILLTPENDLVAIDWESFWLTGLPLNDLLHFHYTNMFRDPKFSIGNLINNNPWVIRYCEILSINIETRRKLALFYLARRIPYLLSINESGRYTLIASHLRELIQ